MNRLTNAFSSAIPSSGSDASSVHARDSPRVSSPLEPSFSSSTHLPTRQTTNIDRRIITQNLIYDDPRSIYHPTASSSSVGTGGGSSGFSESRLLSSLSRPGLLRHRTDDGTGGRGGSQAPTPRVRSQSRERDKGVRVNLMAAANNTSRRGWGMNSATGTTRLNGMAQGPDGKYAIGGGQYLRVFQVYDPSSGSATPIFSQDETSRDRTTIARGSGGVTISEVVNLWKGSWPVGKGVNDLDWGIGAFENKVVTATPSGNIMLFDVERGKLDKDISSGTFRPMNCVRLCRVPAFGHSALTGGTEGSVRYWDLRERDPSNRKQIKHSSPVTSLCFSPEEPYHFVVGLEDGSIRRYDFRMPAKSIGKAYGAHGSKAVMDLKWKDGDEREGGSGGWLASAGADKTVQIWDMSQQWDKSPTPVHTLHTAHPVRRVAWRPDHPTELIVVPLTQPLSSTGTVDSSSPHPNNAQADSDPTCSHTDEEAHLEIWHVRRHYLAKYVLQSQDGVAVDVAWSEGEQSLVACFQNGGFAKMDVKGKIANRSLALPMDAVPRQVVAWSPKGELVYALDRFRPGEIPFDDLKPEYAGHWDKVGRHTSSVSDPPYEPLQTIGFLPFPETDEAEFAYLAKWYKLEGEAPETLCQWNRDIAQWCGREDDARLWSFLKLLIEEFAPSADGFNEDVFSQPLPSTARLQSPLNLSPTRGAESPVSHQATKRGSYDRAIAPIPLERVDQALFDVSTDAVEELLSTASSSSRSTRSYSDSDEDEDGTPPSRSRFLAFAPPEVAAPPASEGRHGSVVTITPRAVSGKSDQARDLSPGSSDGSPPEPSVITSSPTAGVNNNSAGVSGGISAINSKKSSLSKMTASRILAASDFPDPYGIVPDTSGWTSRTSTRSSPTPVILNHSTRASPSPMSTANQGESTQTASMSRGESQNNTPIVGSGTNKQTVGVPPGIEGAPVRAPVRGKSDRFDTKDWEEYKKRRVEGLMVWWQGCVDDGEMQLATAVYVIGSCVAKFPKHQCERLVHAYVDMLERHRLPIPAAYIRQHGLTPSLEITAQDEGMTHTFHCQRCGKSTGSLEDIGVEGKVFWWCKKCRMGAKICAVCRKRIKGLWMGCRKCNHGGHQNCMRLYLSHASLMPDTSSNQAINPSSAASSAGNASGFVTTASLTTTEHSDHHGDGADNDTHVGGGWTMVFDNTSLLQRLDLQQPRRRPVDDIGVWPLRIRTATIWPPKCCRTLLSSTTSSMLRLLRLALSMKRPLT
ncbi:hypothetical protein CI109_104857 [Kwoniella shandongensis]|uniref:Uncharacterized protein n=1 Tax=Kwoniella shandongensis TaxID=1734106 RepID=A0AAJ8MZ36_9TREE